MVNIHTKDLKKWYLILHRLIHSIIRINSKVEKLYPAQAEGLVNIYIYIYIYIYRTLSGAITPGHSGFGSVGNEAVLPIQQSFCITGTLPPGCLELYPRNSLGEFYSSAERQPLDNENYLKENTDHYK